MRESVPEHRQAREDGAAIGVVLVDDHPVVLAGVAALVDQQPDMRVLGKAADLASAVALIDATSPDIVISDIQIGDESGLTLLDHYSDGRPAIILLSSFEHSTYYQTAVERGAAGYVLKAAVVEQLVEAVRDVAAGRLSFPAHVLRRGATAAVRRPSRRELEIIHLVAEGSSNDEIGTRLGISPKTVDSHLRALFDRYQVLSRTELAMLGVREGWLRRAAANTTPGERAQGNRWIVDEQMIRRR